MQHILACSFSKHKFRKIYTFKFCFGLALRLNYLALNPQSWRIEQKVRRQDCDKSNSQSVVVLPSLVYKYLNTHMNMHQNIMCTQQTNTYTHRLICLYTCIHTQVAMSIHMHMHTSIHVYTHMHTQLS